VIDVHFPCVSDPRRIPASVTPPTPLCESNGVFELCQPGIFRHNPLFVLWGHQAVSNNCVHVHQQNVGFCSSNILVFNLPMGGENARPNMLEGATKQYSMQRFAGGLHKTQNLPWGIMMVASDCRSIAMVNLIVVRCFHVRLATRSVLCTFFVPKHGPIMPRSRTTIRRMCPEKNKKSTTR
jgi:hypothetical protein